MKKNKFFAALLSLLIITGTFAGCASDNGASDSYEGTAAGGNYNSPDNDNYARADLPKNEEPEEDEYIYEHTLPILSDTDDLNSPVATTAISEPNAVGRPEMEYIGDPLSSPVDGEAPAVASENEYHNYFNTEEYTKIIESGYKSVADSPLSTFSIDVDTASYANIRRMIENNNYINPEAVRIEEMINYFGYDYENPQGDVPFSVTTELSDCPWNSEAKLMLVGMKAKELEMRERPAMNIVFLIDVSGSMFSDDKLPLVQESLIMLTENLTTDDRVSIVTYAGADNVVLQGESGGNKDKIIEAVASLSAGGSTAGEAGINRAYSIAEEYFIQGGNNRIILATDGDLNVGISSEDELKRLIEEKRGGGVYLSVLGFGTGNIKDNKMQTLADNGNGNYSYIDGIKEAKKVLVEEMTGTLFTVAKDVKIQVEFNPEYVRGYRLVGYENRALADRDFNDDTKDAGEMGAGHTVTALYELILADGLNYDGIELKYQESEPVDPESEICTVSVRHKEPEGNGESKLSAYPVTIGSYESDMPDNIAFASSVAMFGLTLRNSENKGTASCGAILDLLENYDYSGDEYKDEFVYLVRTMRREGY